jgi:hypothetical protein
MDLKMLTRFGSERGNKKIVRQNYETRCSSRKSENQERNISGGFAITSFCVCNDSTDSYIKPKNICKRMDDQGIKTMTVELQKTVIIHSARILRKVIKI